MNPPLRSPDAVSALACVRCAERKVRCDRKLPCNTCTRHNVQCIFRQPKPSRRVRNASKQELMLERLKHYEALLHEKGIDPNQGTPSAAAVANNVSLETGEANLQPSTPPLIIPKKQATVFRPQLIHGQSGSKLADNLWSRLAEEIDDDKTTAEEDAFASESEEVDPLDDFSYVLCLQPARNALSHPPSEAIQRLWQTFVENVNPLTKAVHIPTLQPAIQKAIANIEHVPKGFEALMFSIYSMAVLSLTDNECKEMLGDARAVLLAYYVDATKTALLNAKFMSSTSIVVMQALVLHIFSIRDVYEPRAVWSLTGAAIRVAEGMGLRLDGTLLGLAPFETEIRRRIWWQLKMHDSRAAELCGQAKFRDFDLDESTARRPANINDRDLYPAMRDIPTESVKPTEMMWIVLRAELANFAGMQKAKMKRPDVTEVTSEEYAAMDDMKMKDSFVAEIEDFLETKFLRFCDPSEPLHLLTLLGARSAINLIRFSAHHPRRWAGLDHVPAHEQEFVWINVLQLLERYNMLQTSPQLRRFAWNVPYFIQWHAVIHVLDTLRTHPLHPDTAKAWRLIDSLYEVNSDMLLGTRKVIFLAVGALCLKAFSAREAALSKEGAQCPTPPEYITILREQQQTAKARKQIMPIKSKSFNTPGGEIVTTADIVLQNVSSHTAQRLGEASPQQQSETRQPPYHPQGSTQTADDVLWLSNTLNDSSFPAGVAEMMNLDTADTMAPDSWLATSDRDVIDWAQWDTWFNQNDLVSSSGGGDLGERFSDS